MKKKISAAYVVCMALAAVFFLYLCLNARNELFETKPAVQCVKLEAHSYTQQEDAAAPVGVRDVCILQPEEIPAGSDAVIFQSAHQNVEVYIADNLVFSLKKDISSSVGKSPGHRWNVVSIPYESKGKEVRIELMPVYENKKGSIPDIYIGSQFWIYVGIIRQNMVVVLLSLFAIVMGFAFMVFAAYSSHSSRRDVSLFMMGQFALLIGVWKLSDSGMISMLFGHEEVVSYVPFLTLLLMVIPYTQYVRELFSTKDHRIWDVVCIVSLAVFVFSLAVQVLGIADLREVLWMNHLSMLFLIVVTVPMLYLEVRKVGWSRKLKAMVVCMGACLAGFVADIVIYYISGGVSVTNLGMTGFLIYITVLGFMSLQDAKHLMSIGLQAKHLEQMAYHDQLTGLYNRAAYADDIGQENFVPKNNAVIMLDLNNLKHCNDTYGHEKGDLYITSSAKLIQSIFGTAGKCYRMGGDEFCVLLNNPTEKECEKMLNQLKRDTRDWNQSHDEKFQIQIAAGYALYDRSLDYDIGDTLRRADKMMYREKYEMKQGHAKTVKE